MPVQKCLPGCTCGKHRRCAPDCTCGRHSWRVPRTPEEVELSRKRKLAMNSAWAKTPKALAAQKERNHAHGRRYHLKSKFGLTPEQWDAMLSVQAGCCYLCSEPLVEGAIHVDHDHACCRGKRSCGTCIRGLACQKCNQGIGQFGDSPERMRRVADALEMATRAVRENWTAVQSRIELIPGQAGEGKE